MSERRMSAFEEHGARERDEAWGEMTPVDGGVWARKKLADAYFMACYDRRGLLLTLDSARADLLAELRAAVWAIPWHSYTDLSARTPDQLFIPRAAVLALLEPPR